MRREEDIIKSLEEEGFDRVYLWEDDSDNYYEAHKHDFLKRIVILEGQMNIKINKEERILKEGNTVIINREEVHEVTFGNGGCRYIIAEKD